MKVQTESIVLTNKEGQRLRIYLVEGSKPDAPEFCMGTEDGEHFSFNKYDVDDIIDTIRTIALND